MSAPGSTYRIRLPAPAEHTAHVTLRVATAGRAEVELAMAAWSPGSYLIRDYARFVRDLRVVGDDGAPRTITKRDKSTWVVATAGASELVVDYAVYGHDLTVRTNHIDGTHAFLHGPATFLFDPTTRDAPVTVDVVAPPGWAVSSALAGGALGDPAPDGARTLTAPGIDALLDAPLHLGHTEAHRFVVGATPFELVVWGPYHAGPLSPAQLVTDLAAIAGDHARRVSGDAARFPFSRYTFLLMLAPDAYGGLEHGAGSANLYHPGAFTSRKHYEGLLELLSHELFHAWNGKRIAPPALVRFDYTREAYTRCLWVMEGLTSHYDRFALRTSGRITAKSFLDKVLDDWSRLVATPGRRRASLEDSSFDAWIKLYKPDESNLNTTVSYYLKGGLAALALDLEIRRRSEDARSLDDCLRLLWQRHGATGEPHPEDVSPLFAEATGLDLGDTFARTVRGVDDPRLPEELAAVGVVLRQVADPGAESAAVWLGVTVAGARVTGVFDGSPAAAGLSVGDELVAIDGWRATAEADARTALGARAAGDAAVVTVFRRGRLVTVPVVLAAAPLPRFELVTRVDAPPPVTARYQAWLGEAYPAGETMATVTTTTRAL